MEIPQLLVVPERVAPEDMRQDVPELRRGEDNLPRRQSFPLGVSSSAAGSSFLIWTIGSMEK